MAEYNNPLSGFLGGFSAPLIAREKEDRLLKNQLGLIGLQNDLATQTATATREFDTINQTIESYSSRRDKLTEERNKMLRSLYKTEGGFSMPLPPDQANARIKAMGFEPEYYKSIVMQMDNQIQKLGVGIDQLMVYKTNKYGPSGVTFKHISSIGGLPRPGGAGGGAALGAQTGVDVAGHSPLDPSKGPLSGVIDSVIDTVKPAVTTGSNLVKAGAQKLNELNTAAAGQIRVDPNQKGGPYERWGWTLPGSGAIVEGGVQVIPPLVHKAAVSLGVGIASKDNPVNKFYEKFSRMLGIDPTQTADFWFGGGSSWGKIKAAGKEIPKDFSRVIDWVDGLLIQHGFVPPGYHKNSEGQIVITPGSVRDLMQKEAAAEAGAASVTPGSMEVLPRIDAGDPPPTIGTSTGLGEQSTTEAVPIPAVDLSSVPTYDAFGMDDNIPGSPTGSLRARPSDSVAGIRDRQLQAGVLPYLSTEPAAQDPILTNPYPSGYIGPGDTNILQPDVPLRQGAVGDETQAMYEGTRVAGGDGLGGYQTAVDQSTPGGGMTGSSVTPDSAVTTTPLDVVLGAKDFETMPTGQTAADRLAAYRESIQSAPAKVIDAVVPEGTIVDTWNSVVESLTPEGTYKDAILRKAGASVPGAAVIVGSEIMRRTRGNLTASEALDKSATSAESRAELKGAKEEIKAAKKRLKNTQRLYNRRLKRGGDTSGLAKRLAKAKKAVSDQQDYYRDLVIDRRFRFAGRVGTGLGLFILGAGAVMAEVAGEDAASEFMYEMIEGNEEALAIGIKIAMVADTVALPALALFDNPRPSSSLERKSGPEQFKAPDLQGGMVYNYETTFNRNAYDESLADALASDNVDTFNEARSPRTSIRKRQFRPDDGMGLNPARATGSFPAMNLRSESPSTFDDFVNWLSSIGGSVIPEAEAADVPIESIGLAREVPEMVLNNPRIGIGPKISATESNGLYDAVGYNTVTDEARPPDPMVNTGKWADVRAKYGDTLGIGKYQFTNDFLVDIYADTLNKSKKDAQIFLDNQVFKESVQEQALALAFGYLGLEDVIRGKMSAKRFVDKIEGRWHGIAKAIEEDPNYKQVMIDDLEGMVEQATGRTFTLSNRE